ncbi:hypothetical protein ACJDU8_16285 [Clostridium sp. WILCCON 0269]|uniref:Uncharacterized protein n=1 Tax=Candidatus Clostridium eludens TaxID=3381663 RepID=A0ABW8SM23_9CLOT
MDEKEELKQELEQELQWVKYRMKMLDLIDKKLMQMREIEEYAKEGNKTKEELEVLNAKLNNLATQVNALDEESRKTENGGMIK